VVERLIEPEAGCHCGNAFFHFAISRAIERSKYTTADFNVLHWIPRYQHKYLILFIFSYDAHIGSGAVVRVRVAVTHVTATFLPRV
jgi:hypothetical protein